MTSIAARVATVSIAVLLSACAQVRPYDQAPVYSSQRPGASSAYVEYGVIAAIDGVRGEQQATGGGAIVGGVTGAVIGRQFGGGSDGKALGTLVGAVAGILIGNHLEQQNAGARGGVRVVVQLDRGGQRTFEYADAGGMRIGERVRVEGNQIVRL